MGEAHGSDGMPALGFFDYGAEVGEVVAVVEGGEAGCRGAEEAVEFGVGFVLDTGVQGHGEEEGFHG